MMPDLSSPLPHGTPLHQAIDTAPAGAIAVRFQGRSITYGELCDTSRCLASGLHARGLTQGDVLGLWLSSTPTWLALAFACARLGVAVLSLNPRYGVQEISDLLRRSRARALMHDGSPHQHDVIARLAPSQLAGIHTRVNVRAPDDATGDADHREIGMGRLLAHAPLLDPSDTPHLAPCILLSSSGTTSAPKLIVHRQERVLQHATEVAAALGIDRPESCTLQAVPLCGAFGYTVAMATLAGHGTLVLHETFEAADALHSLDADGITHMFGTNDMLQKMLDIAPSGWRPSRLTMYGHANFTPGLNDLPDLAQRHGVLMRGCFGMSETLALFSAQPASAPLAQRAMSGGVPLSAHSKIRVRNLDTGSLQPPGEPGEIELHTPNVMLGYLDDADQTRAAFTDDGYLRTGDLGYLDDSAGFVHLSRIGDVLRVGGYLVSPLEIEETLLLAGVPLGVTACQVVAVGIGGSARPVAFITANDAYVHQEAALITHCSQQLARFKVPIRVLQLDRFPTTPSPNGEKVRKTELRDMAQRLLAKEASP